MSCNCIRVCDIPKCSSSIVVGQVDPSITIIVQFKDIVTGRIKQVQAESDEEGYLVIDTETIIGFLSENFVYEVTLLANNQNQCNTTTWTIGEETDIECVTVRVVNIPVSEFFDAHFKILE